MAGAAPPAAEAVQHVNLGSSLDDVGRLGEDVPTSPGAHAGSDLPTVHAGGDLPSPGTGLGDQLPGGSAHEHGPGPSVGHRSPTNNTAGHTDGPAHGQADGTGEGQGGETSTGHGDTAGQTDGPGVGGGHDQVNVSEPNGPTTESPVEGSASPSEPSTGGTEPPLDAQFVDDRIKELDDRQGGEGHAPGRHLYPDEQALQDRLGTAKLDASGNPQMYGPNSANAGHVKSENNVDPLTGTTVDGVHGGTHRVGPYATRFDNAEDMVRADQYFRDEIARTGEPPDADVPIEDLLGPEGHKRFTGFYRNPANLNEFLPVDFEGGGIRPVYRMEDGDWKLITMYANPAPGRHP